MYYRTCSMCLVKSAQVRSPKNIIIKKAGSRLAGKIPACVIWLAKRIFQDLLLIKMAHLKYLLKMFPTQ